jgi:AraC-like DNA-binding protein
MARARQLLITSDHTVAEIAASVGYQDPFYFSRQFRAVNGVSPREFRARVHEEASLEQQAGAGAFFATFRPASPQRSLSTTRLPTGSV